MVPGSGGVPRPNRRPPPPARRGAAARCRPRTAPNALATVPHRRRTPSQRSWPRWKAPPAPLPWSRSARWSGGRDSSVPVVLLHACSPRRNVQACPPTRQLPGLPPPLPDRGGPPAHAHHPRQALGVDPASCLARGLHANCSEQAPDGGRAQQGAGSSSRCCEARHACMARLLRPVRPVRTISRASSSACPSA